MLKYASLTTAALVLSVSGACADGKYSPEYNWVGLYLGGTIGYGLGSSETDYNNTQGQLRLPTRIIRGHRTIRVVSLAV